MPIPRLRLRILALTLLAQATTATAGLPALTLDGRRLVDEARRPVTLRGCNLGNWLLLEPWMLSLQREFRDQHDIITTLQQRFGIERTEELLDIYRTNWIGPRELEIARSFGFNVVRLPFHHSLLEAEAAPFGLRADAFEWLDRAVDLSEQAGLYVILDMHGLPGGQSKDMTTGQRDQNRLWTDPSCQERTERLWRRIAERYRSRAAVIAYDLVNEPWGDYHTNNDAELVNLVDRLHRVIRQVDPDKLILAAGSLSGIAFYGAPAERGWHNVGFTEHFYPGMFGFGEPTLEWHARFIGVHLAFKRAELERLRVPYLVGEFNVVFDTCAQPALMRRYYDLYARNGWAATMWSLRILTREGPHDNNWYLLTNGEPFSLPDLRTAGDAEIADAFTRLGAVPLAVDEELRTALTDVEAPAITLQNFSMPSGHLRGAPPGLQLSAIGKGALGAFSLLAEGPLIFAGTGADIWGESDECAFWHEPAEEAFQRAGVLFTFDAPHHFAKAGLMLRADASAGAAHVFLHAHPDGRLIAAWRERAGGPTRQTCLAVLGFPITIELERTPRGLVAGYTAADGSWRRRDLPAVADLQAGGLLGVAVSSHFARLPAEARIALLPTHDAPSLGVMSSAPFHGANVLKEPSLVALAEGGARLAPSWASWGAGWQAQSDGALAYEHTQPAAAVEAGIYQDASGVAAGQRMTFRVSVEPTAGGMPHPLFVELRLESELAGRRLQVAARTWSCDQLAAEGGNLLQIDGTLPAGHARVLVRITGRDGSQGGGLRVTQALLAPVPNR